MPRVEPKLSNTHSPAWVAQAWISFALAVGGLAMGIYCLPVDAWIKGFMSMGLVFSVGSSLSLAKTLRDLHEAGTLHARIDDARVTKLLAEIDPMQPQR